MAEKGGFGYPMSSRGRPSSLMQKDTCKECGCDMEIQLNVRTYAKQKCRDCIRKRRNALNLASYYRSKA